MILMLCWLCIGASEMSSTALFFVVIARASSDSAELLGDILGCLSVRLDVVLGKYVVQQL